MDIDESFKKLLLIFLVMFFVTGTTITYTALKQESIKELSKPVEYQTHTFELSVSDESSVLQLVKYSYNFSNTTGMVSFDLLRDDLQSGGIHLYFPKQLTISGALLEAKNSSFSEGQNYNVEYGNTSNSNWVHLDLLNVSAPRTHFSIQLSGEIKPHGMFEFITVGERIGSSRQNIIIDIGEHECQALCFGFISSVEPYKQDQVVYGSWPRDIGNQTDSKRQVLSLNTFNRRVEGLKQDASSWYISLFICAIVFLVETVKIFVELSVCWMRLGREEMSKKEETEASKFKKLILDMHRGYPNWRYRKMVESVVKTAEDRNALVHAKVFLKEGTGDNEQYSLGPNALVLVSTWKSEELNVIVAKLTRQISILTWILVGLAIIQMTLTLINP